MNPKKGLLEISLFILLLILVVAVLNYFNIIPLSNTFPQLGFLPKKSDQIPQAPIPQNTLSMKISCPSIPEICKSESGIIKDGKYIGWGGVLATGSAIFAAFDGIVSSTISTFPKEENGQKTEVKFTTAYLDNSDLGLRAIYYFRGSAPKAGWTTKGQQIAISNGKTISIYDDKSLVFSLISGYPNNNTPSFLNKESFEQ